MRPRAIEVHSTPMKSPITIENNKRKVSPGYDRFKFGWSFIATCMATLLLSCDTGANAPEDITFPDSEISYGRSVQPLFDVGCNFSGCHNTIDRAGNLSLDSYFDLIAKPGVVVPGDSTRSLLVQVVRERSPHTTPISRIISHEQAQGIAQWVHEGASNN